MVSLGVLLCLLTCSKLIQAQKVNYGFLYDSTTGKYKLTEKYTDLNKNETYRFKVEGVNTAYFDVAFQASSKDLKSAVPEILKSVIPGLPGEVTLEKFHASYASETKNAIDAYNLLNSVVMNTKQLMEKIKNKPHDYKACMTEARLHKKKLDNILMARDTSMTAALERIEEQKDIFLSNYNYVSETIKIFHLNEQEVRKNFFVLACAKQGFDRNKELYTKAIELLYTTLRAENFKEKEFYVKKEMTTIRVVIVDKFKGDTVINKSYEYFTKGGLDFDLTTGFFVSDLYSKSYYIDKDNVDGTPTIKQEKSPGFDLGIGALAHLNYRFTSAVKGGLCVGAYLSTFDGKARYGVGPSFVFFRKNQLSLSGGLVAGKISKLSSVVSSNGTTVDKTLPATIAAVPVYDKWETGWFMSVTYNLGRN